MTLVTNGTIGNWPHISGVTTILYVVVKKCELLIEVIEICCR